MANYNQPPSKALLALAKTQQFYWFVGHVLAFLFFVLHTLTSFFRPSSALRYYRFSLLSILLTYFIVIKQVHLRKGFSANGLARDENVQYFVFALVLYLSSFVVGVVSSSLYSFIIFGVFHILGYVQNHIVPAALPSLAAQQRASAAIGHISSTYNQPALFVAANAEVILVLLMIFQLPIALISLVFRGSLAAFLVQGLLLAVSVVFNKLRFDSSQYTKAVVAQYDGRAKEMLAKYNPRALGVYERAKGEFVRRVSVFRVSEKKVQ